MKTTISLLVAIFILSFSAMSQSSVPAIDKSPLDMSYYPSNYPVLKIQDKITDPVLARVIYSRPKREGRTIFGGLVEYGSVWRLGANEATEIELYKQAYIGGKKIAKGRYTLYAIVNEKNWTFIVNKENDTWGSFKYNPAKDIIRVDVPVEKLNEPVESLSMFFDKNAGGIKLVVEWENAKVALPIII